MRAIDADELIEACQKQIGILEEWSHESGVNCDGVRKGYSMMIDLLRSAETLNVVTRHEYDRTIEEYEFLINNMKEEVELHHVGCDSAMLGYEK